MNLEEYRANKIKNVKHFLRGLNFENIGIKDKPILSHLTPECSDFFNNNEVYRKLTEALLSKINQYYNDLVFTNIEFAKSKEEIDLEIKKFVDSIRKEVDLYKHSIIKVAFQPKKQNRDEAVVVIDELQEVKEKNLLNTGLNFIKLKIGETIYLAPKLGSEAEKKDVILDDLSIMIVYIYALKEMIEDKNRKQEEFIDFIATNFNVKDEKYLSLRKLQSIFLNEKNYDNFVEKYNKVSEEVVWAVIEREQELEETKPKSRG